MLLVALGNLNAQTTYEEIDNYGNYRSNWERVTLNSKYGFINKNGKEVVKPKYNEIENFNDYWDGWALVIIYRKRVL